MAFPTALAGHLEAERVTPPPRCTPAGERRFAQDSICVGARHHSPTPLILQPVSLDPLGRNSAAPMALLCGTCGCNVAVLLALMLLHDGKVPWAVRRDFGNLIRALAAEGWAWYLEEAERAD